MQIQKFSGRKLGRTKRELFGFNLKKISARNKRNSPVSQLINYYSLRVSRNKKSNLRVTRLIRTSKLRSTSFEQSALLLPSFSLPSSPLPFITIPPFLSPDIRLKPGLANRFHLVSSQRGMCFYPRFLISDMVNSLRSGRKSNLKFGYQSFEGEGRVTRALGFNRRYRRIRRLIDVLHRNPFPSWINQSRT